MKFHSAIALVILLTAPELQAERLLDQSPDPEKVLQSVLKDIGIETAVVKPYDSMKQKSDRDDGGYFIGLDGSIPIRLILNEDYWALVTVGPKTHYMLNPRDEQSALNISVGEGFFSQSDEDLRRSPGFTEITQAKGTVGDRTSTWRRWSDAYHLYSDCTELLAVEGDQHGSVIRVNISVTANTEARRISLEKAMETLEILPKQN